MKAGRVYLVGAGPGDPALLTVRAAELLRAADVVAHDELVDERILALVPASAELLPVGRRHGKGETPWRIHPAVLERALAGKSVVRLKSGDPCIFGRAGEEAEELARAGIPFEIVPGVSAALGAAAYAGIPLTDRRHASSVTLSTGHLEAHDHGETPPPADAGTLVLYMAARRLPAILRRLVDGGRSPDTKAAWVAAATRPEQRVVVGTLADLASKTANGGDAPAVVIVGEVVSLREKLAWFEERPLRGKTVLVGRVRPGPSAIATELRGLGATVVEAPHVEVSPLADTTRLDRVLTQLRDFTGVIFGCSAAVEAALARLAALGRSPRDLARWTTLAIGKESREALIALGLEPTLAVQGHCHAALQDALSPHAALLGEGRWLLITSSEGRPSLEADLATLGARVETVAAYRFERSWPRIPVDSLDLVVFPSSSAARNLLTSEWGEGLSRVANISMGEKTADEARKLGARRVSSPEDDSVEAVVALALERLTGREAAHVATGGER